jgi:hypothetical protein
MYKMWTRHQYEFKYHGRGLILITIMVIYERAGKLNEYWYVWKLFNDENFDHPDKISKTYITFQILGWQMVILVLAIVLFKKD